MASWTDPHMRDPDPSLEKLLDSVDGVLPDDLARIFPDELYMDPAQIEVGCDVEQ
jgi:hypothetical protein